MRNVPKRVRQHRILELVAREPLGTQEDLVKRLARDGMHVTQGTLSRDIKELGLLKTPEGYAVPGAPDTVPPPPSVARLVREFVTEVREAQNLLVIKTSAGSAQPVAAALDAAGWSELVGTLAGDDTILAVTAGPKDSRAVGRRIREFMQG